MAQQQPKIITFYSYKGGVGRTMALANIACLLAKWGKKLLLIDWDLEAPGLHSFFLKPKIQLSGGIDNTAGIVDLLNSCLSGQPLSWKECLIRVEFGDSALDLITAGKQDGDYQKKIQQLDWEVLFANGIGNYFNSLRDEWLKSGYDYIFIDSRTGITDIGDICTVILPDIVILLFVSNYQNINGINKLYDRALSAHKQLPVNRGKLIAVPIPTRDEQYNEYDSAQAWKKIYAEQFERLYSNWLPSSVTPLQALNKLFIPYVTKWSFGENLPVIENDLELQIPTSISTSYARIALLISYDLDWKKLEITGDGFEFQSIRSELTQVKASKDALEFKARQASRKTLLYVLAVSAVFGIALIVFFLQPANNPPQISDTEVKAKYFTSFFSDSALKTLTLPKILNLYDTYSNLDSETKTSVSTYKLTLDSCSKEIAQNNLGVLYDTSTLMNSSDDIFADTIEKFGKFTNIPRLQLRQDIYKVEDNSVPPSLKASNVQIVDFTADSSGFHGKYKERYFSIFKAAQKYSILPDTSLIAFQFNNKFQITQLYLAGVPTASLPARVYIEIANEDQRKAGDALKALLTQNSITVPGIENVAKLGANVPTLTEIRYYANDEMEMAKALIKLIRRTYPNWKINDTPQKVSKNSTVRPNHFEIWFADSLQN